MKTFAHFMMFWHGWRFVVWRSKQHAAEAALEWSMGWCNAPRAWLYIAKLKFLRARAEMLSEHHDFALRDARNYLYPPRLDQDIFGRKRPRGFDD